MKKAAVLGASGSIGYAIVMELIARGIEVTAFARGESRLASLFGEEEKVNIFPGDAFDMDRLIEATAGADVIFHAMNLPYYEWESRLPVLMSNILNAAERNNARLVVVDNIYAYGKGNGTKVTEDTPKVPHTKKGRIRFQLETMVKQSGIPAIIAHFPDFYGPHAGNTMLHYTFQGVLSNKRAMFIGNQKRKREYIYTPDGAKALVQLSLCDSAYGQNWNIPGSGVISGEEIVQILREETGYRKRVGTVTKPMLWLLGLVDKMMKEVVEMMYLTENPVVLSGEKLEKQIGKIPMTPYQTGIVETLKFMGQKRSS
ncbi:NAD-dependent epimerase/dehydratase family protein [Brevibacillus sp. H7]|uniref:NAD-dependent epimerase/dehydratase family protein n=1 Tax=Brevibacillus sp. H7 TaxID=3349138 RepID=UPI00381752D7